MLNFKIDLSGIEKLRAKLLANPSLLNEIRAAFGTLYRSFVRRRFDRASKGSGDWRPLAPSTIRRRRRGRGTGSVAILRDTGALFASLSPTLGASGSIQSLDRPLGISVMLGGSPISTIAQYHNEGNSRLPQRQILVEPDQPTRDKMNEVAAKIATKYANQ